jgi:hypothetical protein
VFASRKGERHETMAGKVRSLIAIYHWSSEKRRGMGTSTRTCMEVLSGLMKFRLEDSEKCTARSSWMIKDGVKPWENCSILLSTSFASLE